ncbi:MAG: M23 family metallopeptidase [Rikenellaceae bacterium]
MARKKILIIKKILRLVFYLIPMLGMAIGCYFLFSIFFDTPAESEIRKTNTLLKNQYEMLSQEYEKLDGVLNAIKDRDRDIYSVLFEALPYATQEVEFIDEEELFGKRNNELAAIFFKKLKGVEQKTNAITNNFDSIQVKMQRLGSELDYIPAIQPIANKELTKLATSYGQRIHPFYKTLMSHQGVDYTVPEDSRIFATADGTVKEVTPTYSNNGLTVILDHQNGYSTVYSHLNKATVKRGQKVKRGDIIAHSGNTGMSFMPHLHYEIIYKGMRIDPINYFFMELNHINTKKINDIAKIGMQSLD